MANHHKGYLVKVGKGKKCLEWEFATRGRSTVKGAACNDDEAIRLTQQPPSPKLDKQTLGELAEVSKPDPSQAPRLTT